MRYRAGLNPARQLFFAYQTNPTTVTPFSWFGALSDPVRSRQGLKTGEMPAFTGDTAPIPISKLIPWYMILAEPVRFRQGLAAARQQFLAEPSRLLPTPVSFAAFNALETKDTFTGSARVWIRVVEGEVGIIEQNTLGAEIGVIAAAPSPGTSGVIDDAVSPASGSAVPLVTTASIAIRVI